MALLGQAAITTWNNILPERRADFIEWHNREHIPERVGLRGFLRGRRYLAQNAKAEYFTLYETDDIGTLVGSEYVARLNDPTPLTRDLAAQFRDTSRAICTVAFSEGVGIGGFMLTCRFGPEPGSALRLHSYLTANTLSVVLQGAGVVGAHLCVSDTKSSQIETEESKGRDIAVPDWVLLIEATSADSARTAFRDSIGSEKLVQHGARTNFDIGLYTLEIARAKHD